jgi:hypothetical protein
MRLSSALPGFLSDPALPTVVAVVAAMLALAITFR